MDKITDVEMGFFISMDQSDPLQHMVVCGVKYKRGGVQHGYRHSKEYRHDPYCARVQKELREVLSATATEAIRSVVDAIYSGVDVDNG